MRVLFAALLTLTIMSQFTGEVLGQSYISDVKILWGNGGSGISKDITYPIGFAYIDHNSGYLYIGFSQSIGESYISIAALGGELTSTITCNVNAGTNVQVQVPQNSGKYVVTIIAEEFQGFGFFMVE